MGTEEDSIHQLDRAAQVTIFRLRTGHCQLLSHLNRLKIFPFRRISMWHRSSTPQPRPAVLSHLLRFETPDMDQSGGCPQEALGTGWDTAADCGLRLTHRTEDLAWPGTQKKKKLSVMIEATTFHNLTPVWTTLTFIQGHYCITNQKRPRSFSQKFLNRFGWSLVCCYNLLVIETRAKLILRY